MTWPRCTFTVISLVPSSNAICLFNMPETTRLIPSLARGEGVITFSQRGETTLLLAPRSVPIQGLLDRIEQILTQKRFGQEFHRTGFHGLHRHGNIAMAGDE